MTLGELVARFRVLADDNVETYFFDEGSVIEWLNDAQNEAAIRSRLIHESSDATVCEIAITDAASRYALHESVCEITYLAHLADGDTDRTPVCLVSTIWLDSNVADWRTETGAPEYAVQDDTGLRLVPAPDAAGTIYLECFRLPLVAMAAVTAEPEIHKAHHRHLIDWALFQAFSVPDSETFDPSRAAKAEAEFERYFGLRPTADLKRSTRHDVPQHNEPFWP